MPARKKHPTGSLIVTVGLVLTECQTETHDIVYAPRGRFLCDALYDRMCVPRLIRRSVEVVAVAATAPLLRRSDARKMGASDMSDVSALFRVTYMDIQQQQQHVHVHVQHT